MGFVTPPDLISLVASHMPKKVKEKAWRKILKAHISYWKDYW